MPITPDQFERYEAIVLSGQVPQEDVPAPLRDNPEFAAWYEGRSGNRKIDPDAPRLAAE